MERLVTAEAVVVEMALRAKEVNMVQDSGIIRRFRILCKVVLKGFFTLVFNWYLSGHHFLRPEKTYGRRLVLVATK
jgi:hypothetical protein